MILKGQTSVKNYIDFQDVEPKNPVKGQKYYDGEKVNTWNGSEWEVIVNPTQLEKDIASAAQSGENAGAAADEAMTEAEGARTRANSAVDKADKANEDISIISNTVDGHTSQISSLGDNLNLRVKKD
ncbi:MAG: alanine-zipper protein, partial [Tetragenococcus halophilus]|nr:alanine-zipper protein [Tetragenococcus halophilus]